MYLLHAQTLQSFRTITNEIFFFYISAQSIWLFLKMQPLVSAVVHHQIQEKFELSDVAQKGVNFLRLLFLQSDEVDCA